MIWITFGTAMVNVTVACMFLGAWWFTRQRALWCFAGGYGFFAFSFFLFAFKDSVEAVVYIGNVLMFIGTLLAAEGMAARAPWRIPWRTLFLIAAFGIGGTVASYVVDNSDLRQFTAYVPLGLIYLLVALAGLQAKSPFKVEKVFVAALFAVAFVMLTNPRYLAGVFPQMMSREWAESTWPIYAVIWIVLSQLLAGLTIALSMRDVILRARREALTDPLSGLANRRAFDAALERPGRDGDRPALLMIDIDHFKQINDRLGHDEGDRAIAMLGNLIAACAPKGACAARLGGEEFGVLLNDGGLAAANTVARMIHRAVAETNRALDFTISIGVAEGARSELYRRADMAVYDAKRLGRDRTCVWEPQAPRANPSEQPALVGRAAT
ncbi:MAG: GGDEF domain-containing protein [Pseudomonadota bacterium]